MEPIWPSSDNIEVIPVDDWTIFELFIETLPSLHLNLAL